MTEIEKAITILIAIGVGGCSVQSGANEKEKSVVMPAEKPTSISDMGVRVWADPETGCEYLLYFSGGITPRYAKGGSSYEQQHVKGCEYK